MDQYHIIPDLGELISIKHNTLQLQIDADWLVPGAITDQKPGVYRE